ncbi:hypothetical protein [Nannocystis pusilla]|uniref:hypothetical protein n=1 Tax=Nannocystis pusilla TaxID=889268 RepID=UPI003B7C8650
MLALITVEAPELLSTPELAPLHAATRAAGAPERPAGPRPELEGLARQLGDAAAPPEVVALARAGLLDLAAAALLTLAGRAEAPTRARWQLAAATLVAAADDAPGPWPWRPPRRRSRRSARPRWASRSRCSRATATSRRPRRPWRPGWPRRAWTTRPGARPRRCATAWRRCWAPARACRCASARRTRGSPSTRRRCTATPSSTRLSSPARPACSRPGRSSSAPIACSWKWTSRRRR